MDKRHVRTAEELLEEQLQDPGFRERWERTALARAVANRLIAYRAEHGLSQARLAKVLGVKQPRVARLEIGEHNPTWETLILLAGKLGISFVLEIGPAERGFVLEPKAAEGAEIEKVTSRASGTRAYVVTSMAGPTPPETAR